MPSDSVSSNSALAERPHYDSAHRSHPFVEELQELWRFRELIFMWAARNIKLRYKRSFLGILWTLIEPLMLMIILTVVFSRLFRFQVENYPIYLLSGLLLFDFLSRTTLQIVEEIVASQGLASRVHVPRSVFAVATVVSYLVSWLVALIPLFIMMVFFAHHISLAVITLPLGMLLTAAFALGVGLIVGTLGAWFHDVKLTYQVLLTGWMYATPIIYPLEIVPESFRTLFQLNPLLHLLIIVRDPVYLGTPAPISTWLVGTAIALGFLILGWWVFTSQKDRIGYRA